MTTAAPARPLRSSSISTRLTLTLLPLVMIPLLVMGLAAYVRAQQLLGAAATAHLSSAVIAEYKVLQDWARAREDRIALSSQSGAVPVAVSTLLAASASPTARNDLFAAVDGVAVAGGETLFSDVMVVRASDHQVMASTDSSHEGRMVPALDAATIPLDQLATTPVYNDPLFSPNDFAIVTSIPMDQTQVLWEERGGYRIELGQTFIAMAPDVIVSYPRYATEPQVTPGVSHPVFGLALTTPSRLAEHFTL